MDKKTITPASVPNERKTGNNLEKLDAPWAACDRCGETETKATESVLSEAFNAHPIAQNADTMPKRIPNC